MSKSKRQDVRRPVVSGIVWLGLGLYMLAINSGSLPPIDESWPVTIIIVGVALIAGSLLKSKRSGRINTNS